MSEPTSSAAGGLFAWKLVGGAAGFAAGGAGLAAIIVMLMTPPRSPREWAVGLISTVLGSICGGAVVVQHFALAGVAHRGYVGPGGRHGLGLRLRAAGLGGGALGLYLDHQAAGQGPGRGDRGRQAGAAVNPNLRAFLDMLKVSEGTSTTR
jgi:hypothetical protein